nr:P63C domain-containing protein [uncultured Holophaga sp.]
MSKQAEGGRARADKLSQEARSAIAKMGAQARWTKPEEKIPKETHAGELKIGDKSIPCSVLEDGTRVFSQRAILRVMGASVGGRRSGEQPAEGVAQMPRFLASKALKSHISEELTVMLESPLIYQPRHGGRSAMGYEATVLTKICSSILDARDAGDLLPKQMPLAMIADMLIRAFAQVGIIALIDEATGYQAERDKSELQRLLSVYLSEERLKWISRFPREFFDQIFRLRGWAKPLNPNHRPQFMGKLINRIVYEQLPEGVLEELKKRNPVDYDTKRRKWKHHQFLSEEIGQPDLREHVLQLIAIMRISDSWIEFEKHFIRAFLPKAGVQQELDFGPDGE